MRVRAAWTGVDCVSRAAEGLTRAKATELENLLLGRDSPSSRASPAVVALGPSVAEEEQDEEEEEEEEDTGQVAREAPSGVG